jgi:lysophospholipase L1-like esterase
MRTTGKRAQGRSPWALTMTLVLALLAALLLAGTALAVATPGKPTAKAPKGTITQAKPTFKWSKAARAAKYEVRVYKGSKLLVRKTGITKLSWKSSKALRKNVSLTWKVRARNAAGNGAWSKSLKLKVVTTPSSTKAITAFSFATPAAPGSINESAHTIALTLPFGTDVSALVATFATTGASVKVGSTLQTSGLTSNNFSSPVTYTVTAANGTTQAYTVTVTVAHRLPGAVPFGGGKVMFAGDSLTAGFYAVTAADSYRAQLETWLTAHGGLTYETLSVYGANSAGAAANAAAITASAPDLLIIELGTNDCSGYPSYVPVDPDVFEDNLRAIADAALAGNPSCCFAFLSVWQAAPSRNSYNVKLAAVAVAYGGVYVSLSAIKDNAANSAPSGVSTYHGDSDGWHPNNTGHAAIAAAVISALQGLL